VIKFVIISSSYYTSHTDSYVLENVQCQASLDRVEFY